MPEGDTVYRTARLLRRTLAGAQLTGADLRVPRLATTDLTGGTVADCASRGKHLLLRLHTAGDERWTLHSHLGMEGGWRVYAVGERWRGQPAHLVRAVLRTTTTVAVGSQLRQLALVPTREEERLVGHLGPDLLGDDWDPDEAVRRLTAVPGRPVADALLDQRVVAGIGTVYCGEVLFLRGVHPAAPVGRLDRPESLLALAQRLMAANRDRVTRSTTGSLRRGATTYVYGRAGAACRRCGTPVVSDEAGTDRVVYWCPSCQPEVPSLPSVGSP